MKLLIGVCSKGRAKVFDKYAKQFIEKLPYDKVLVLEKEDYDDYDFDNKLMLEKSNQGFSYALTNLKNYAKENSYDLVFKIDDDVKTIGEVWNDLEVLVKQFEKYKDLGAICFPYSFEFYNISEELFTHINRRLQTCYLIRIDSWHIDKKASNLFEDFYNFMMIINSGQFTLFCSRHAIMCKPVGSGSGGIQSFDRRKLAIEAIREFKEIDPTIEVIEKEEKSWGWEPKLTHKKYQAIKLKK